MTDMCTCGHRHVGRCRERDVDGYPCDCTEFEPSAAETEEW